MNKFNILLLFFLIFSINQLHGSEVTSVQEKLNPEEDRGRFSFMGGVNLNPKKALKTMSGEIQYDINWGHFWGSAFLNYTKGDFASLSENPSNISGDPTAESNNRRPDNSKALLSNYGLGVLYRHHFPESVNLLKIKNIYQTTAFYLTYNSFNDHYRSVNYKGPGLKTQYGLFKRVSNYSEIGINLSYHLAEVKRSEISSTEASHDRSLRISYLTIAFGLSFYY